MTDTTQPDVAATEDRQLYVAEVALRTFARSATGPGDRPQSLALLLAEYDRRGAEIERLRAELAAAKRSMPEVTAVEPGPETRAMIERWYDRMDGDADHRATYAVQVAEDAIDNAGSKGWSGRSVVDALARAGWLHDPAEIERMRAVTDVWLAMAPNQRVSVRLAHGRLGDALAALDAAAAGATTSIDPLRRAVGDYFAAIDGSTRTGRWDAALTRLRAAYGGTAWRGSLAHRQKILDELAAAETTSGEA